jgi:hypothetical protein
MTHLRAVALLGLAAFATSGCFDIQQTLTLERNLSGTAGFSMKIDMEPMVAFMVRMQREMAGKTGDPTPEELAKARAEFTSSAKEKPTDFDAEKRELASKLPAGVSLVDASFTQSDLAMAVNLLFGFDQVSKLAAIQLPKSKDAKEGPGNPVDSPFGDLKVVDEGDTLLITGPPQNPAAGARSQAPPDPETQKMVQEMMGGLRVGFRITAPFEIVQHNAHRKEGNSLIWEYDLKALEKLTPEQLNSSIKIRYRK